MKTPELPEIPQTTVHEALAEASLAGNAEHMRNFSVRLPESLIVQAKEICARNGAELGTYLRECARALCRDYGHTESDKE